MKCKDIPDLPILEFLWKLEHGKIADTYLRHNRTVTWFPSCGVVWIGAGQSVQHAMPKEIHGREKLVRTKMRSLIDRGLVSGCACGCRGDFKLTDKGRVLTAQPNEQVSATPQTREG